MDFLNFFSGITWNMKMLQTKVVELSRAYHFNFDPKGHGHVKFFTHSNPNSRDMLFKNLEKHSPGNSPYF